MGSTLRDGTELKLWTIEKLVPGGAGLCRLEDGSVGFVEGAFPGETLRPLETLKKKDYVRATRFELVTASAERVAAPCPVVDACGGCDWMKLARSAELSEKAKVVAQALERTGGVKLSALPEVVTAGGELAYRSRVRLHVDDRGRVGFHARGSHAVVEVPGCSVAEPEVERGMAIVRALAQETPRAMASFEAVEVRTTAEGELEFVLHPHRDAEQRERGDGRRSAEAEALVERLEEHGNARFARTGADFGQVNRAVNDALVLRVVEGALARGARRFLDLYAGAGNFAVPLARAGLAGIAVENDARAVSRGRERAVRDAAENLRFFERDVRSALGELARSERGVDLVLLDPPRTGAKDAIPGIVAVAPRFIGYVACDPVTLARDVRALGASGWNVVGVTCFDMFPKTHHVETLAWLEHQTEPG